ncbi:MAG: SprB repeat-containing protein, partial [Bacteroidota bacterium]
DPDPLFISFNFDTILCDDNSITNIVSNINGGTAPYFFNWSNGSTEQDLIEVGIGSYDVTVKDALNCEYSSTLEILESPPIEYEALVEVAACDNSSLGSIQILNLDGDGPFVFDWSNGETGNAIFDLEAGNYSVVITDNNSCTKMDTFIIYAPGDLALLPDVINESCSSSSDGEISIEIIGGTAPYEIIWSNEETGSLITNLSAGTYTVIIRDALGCTIEGFYILEVESELSIIPAIKDESCANSLDGSISLEITGGQAPYTVLWEDGFEGLLREDLSQGEYKVEISDASGCFAEASLLVGLLGQLELESSIRNQGCFGESDGGISINITEGRGPFQFNWNNGNEVKDLDNVPADTYELRITDSLQCAYDFAFTIESAEEIEIEAILQSNPCPQDSNGSISLTLNNAASPINYIWSNGSGLSSIERIPNGEYGVTIEDGNGCIKETVYNLVAAEALAYELRIQQGNCIDPRSNSVELTFPREEPTELLWDDGSDQQRRERLEEGSYGLRIRDNNGCIYNEVVVIEEVENPVIGEFPNQENKFCDLNPVQIFYNESNERIPTGAIRQFVISADVEDPLNNPIVIIEDLIIDPVSLNLEVDERYFIYAIIALPDANGNVDANDPCIAQSQGFPIEFINRPIAELPDDIEVCANEELEIEVELFGLTNYFISYAINNDLIEQELEEGNLIIELYAEENTQIAIVSITDLEDGCTVQNLDTININVRRPDTTYLNFQTCIPEEVRTIERIEENQFTCDSVVIEVYTLNDDCNLDVEANIFPINCESTST